MTNSNFTPTVGIWIIYCNDDADTCNGLVEIFWQPFVDDNPVNPMHCRDFPNPESHCRFCIEENSCLVVVIQELLINVLQMTLTS